MYERRASEERVKRDENEAIKYEGWKKECSRGNKKIG